MNIILRATPYDISTTGFYFSGPDEFEKLYDANAPVEEYGIQFIDEPAEACELFKAMNVSQSGINDFFEAWDELESEPQFLVGICFLMTEHGCAVDEARDRVEDLALFEGSLENHGYELVEECVFKKGTPEVLRS